MEIWSYCFETHEDRKASFLKWNKEWYNGFEW